jgi:hypothetical protein
VPQSRRVDPAPARLRYHAPWRERRASGCDGAPSAVRIGAKRSSASAPAGRRRGVPSGGRFRSRFVVAVLEPDAGLTEAGAANAEAAADQGSYPHAEYYAPDAAVDVGAWLREHAVSSKFGEATCWDAGLRVGVPPAAGLVCERSMERPPRTFSRVYRLENGKLRLVWEEVVKTYANWVDLTPVLSPTGAELTLHDSRRYRCAGAIGEARAKQDARVHPPSFTRAIEAACARRGVYTWNGKRYVLATKQALDAAMNALDWFDPPQ